MVEEEQNLPSSHESFSEGRLPLVYFSLGAHTSDNVEYLSNYKAKAELLLDQHKSGKVIMFIETADLPQEVCNALERFMEDTGAPPLAAFTYLASQLSLNDASRKQIINEVETPGSFLGSQVTFFLHQLLILEELVRKYPGRVGVLFEGSAQDATVMQDLLTRRKDESLGKLVQEGELEEALLAFKESARSQAKLTSERDKIIVDRIRKALEKEDVLAVIVRIGATHSSLARTLRKEGYCVEVEFDRVSERGLYVFNLGESLIRSFQFNPRKEPSRIEWLQALVGLALEGYVYLQSEIQPGDRSSYEVQLLINKIVRKKLASEEQILCFGKRIREKGLGNACQSLIGPPFAFQEYNQQ